MNLPYFSIMIKNFVLIVLLFAFNPGYTAFGQDEDFCNAVLTITHDGVNKFRNTRGKLLDANMNATNWACGIKIPGTINSRFVASMGLFYEGAFYQTRNKDSVRAVYDKYKDLLRNCLKGEGFKMSTQDNFFPGMSAYKKLVFMQEMKEDAKVASAPPHLAMEATYSKDIGLYTVVLYIFEH